MQYHKEMASPHHVCVLCTTLYLSFAFISGAEMEKSKQHTPAAIFNPAENSFYIAACFFPADCPLS